MKVLLINTLDRGGAASACIRLHQSLLNHGVNSKLLVKIKTKKIKNSFEFKNKHIKNQSVDRKKNFFERLAFYPFLKKLYKREKGLEYFSYPESKIDITESEFYKGADIIHLHWVADFIDYETFFKKNQKPVIWTLHDTNPFSGGEHYSEEYNGVDDNGLPIKRKIKLIERYLCNEILKIKAKSLKEIREMSIVVLNDWMEKEVQRSIFRNYSILKIPNGIDKDMFKSYSKEQCRKELNLPIDKNIILFVADSLNNQRKGFAYLKMAMENDKLSNILFCSVGDRSRTNIYSEKYYAFGRIEDVNLLNKIYCAADLFVIPSLIDNLPNTIIESFFSGTPVLGFPVGGINDMIENNVNGLLTERIGANELVEGIIKFFREKDNFDSNRIREDAINRYDQEAQFHQYLNLYNNIFKN